MPSVCGLYVRDGLLVRVDVTTQKPVARFWLKQYWWLVKGVGKKLLHGCVVLLLVVDYHKSVVDIANDVDSVRVSLEE